MSVEEAFWKIHDGLPRQAPGSDGSTLHLLELAGNPTGKGLEIGCGQGRASLLLAGSGIELIATDTHQPFLDELDSAARLQGISNKLTTRNMPMERLSFPEASFNLIWSEGSAYIMGWERAIRSWKQYLKQDGLLVATECCWLTDTPSEEINQFWTEAYPAMLTAKDAADAATQSSYTVIDTYTLPASDWWDEYYSPLKDRIVQLKDSEEEGMQFAIAKTRHEIEMYEKYGNEYGYVGFILRKNS